MNNKGSLVYFSLFSLFTLQMQMEKNKQIAVLPGALHGCPCPSVLYFHFPQTVYIAVIITVSFNWEHKIT